MLREDGDLRRSSPTGPWGCGQVTDVHPVSRVTSRQVSAPCVPSSPKPPPGLPASYPRRAQPGSGPLRSPPIFGRRPRRTPRSPRPMESLALKVSSGGGCGGVTAANWAAGGRNVGTLLARRSSCWTLTGGCEDVFWCGNGVLRVGAPGECEGRGVYPRCRSPEVRASGKKKGAENSPSPDGGDPSTPDGDDSEESVSGKAEPEPDDSLVEKSHQLSLDWRTFRANLVAQEKGLTGDSNLSSKDSVSPKPLRKLGSKWAHPIPAPETGCLLISTDKLDGVRTFERTVILLVRMGSRDPRDGPFGVILNRPLNKKIKHMKPTNPDLANMFADCSLHFGGPLDASMFLLKIGQNPQAPHFEQVVPGICFGTRNSLNEAASLVKRGIFRPQDFQFFIGYAGWQVDQLREEIDSNYWIVLACSSELISSALSGSSSGLWEEILLLMGGPYIDLSQKAKEDDDP